MSEYPHMHGKRPFYKWLPLSIGIFFLAAVAFTVTSWLMGWGLRVRSLAILGLTLSSFLFGISILWVRKWITVAHWTILNYILPIAFILLPPIFAAIFFAKETGESQNSFTVYFFPTYYSLMVVVATIFILLQTEIEDFR